MGFQDTTNDLFIHGRLAQECRCIRSLRGISQFGQIRSLRLIGIEKLSLEGLEEISQSVQSIWIEACMSPEKSHVDISPLSSV